MAWDFDFFGSDFDLGDTLSSVGDTLGLFTSGTDYSGITPGGEQWNMLQDQDFDFNSGDWDLGGLLRLGTQGYKAYSAGQRAEDMLAPYKAQQAFYEQMLPQLKAHYDPETARRNIRRGVEKQSDIYKGLWSEEDAQRRAQQKRYGMSDATPYNIAREKTLGKRGDILSSIEPSVSQQYYAGPQGLFTGLKNVGGFMGQQPSMSTEYQNLSRAADPWSTFLDDYIKNV